LFSILSLAQEEDVSVVSRSTGLDLKLLFEQQPYSKKLSDKKTTIEYINAMDEAQPGTPILPSKTYFIAIPPLSKIRINIIEQKYNFINNVEVALNPEVQVSNDSILVYRDSKPDLSKFIYDQFPSLEFEVIDYTWLRDYYCAVVKINTHTFNWKKKEIRELISTSLKIDFIETVSFNLNQSPIGEFDKILSKIILNYAAAAQFRSFISDYFPADSTGNWIDYSREYVKLQIPDDGIYRIDYDQIVNYGINPASVNPKTFKVFSKGNEVPIYVSGESDLSFDQGDLIEFWSEKNYGSPDYKEIVLLGEDYLNYFDRYSDTSIVWLSWDGNEGKRVDIQNTTISGLTDSLFTHKVFEHLEEDERLWYYDAVSPRVQLPNWQENKVWTWHFLGNGGSIQFNFTASDFVPGTSVNVTARMISNATDQLFTNNHRFGLSLNSPTPEDTIV
ncbi:MAG TPA: C25 family peptidase propeptide domain-containing protein, partial [Ignavibacteriaceae bacterium]